MSIPEVKARRNTGVRIPVDVDGVHEELKGFNHWVVWKAVLKGNGELDKWPYNACTGDLASVVDSRTWSTFDDAIAAYVREGWDGVGFVFSSGDPYTGIDLDGVRDPETGDLADWARKAVDTFNSYTEASPSGEGIHIYVRGRTVKARKGSSIEVYSTGRFFTVTGVRP